MRVMFEPCIHVYVVENFQPIIVCFAYNFAVQMASSTRSMPRPRARLEIVFEPSYLTGSYLQST